MNRKFKWLITLLLITSAFIAQAQQPKPHKSDNPERKERKQKIKALYTEYMTRELQLNEGDAQKFWPVQEQYSAEIKAVNKQNQISELDKEEAILKVRRKYNEKFSKLIGKDRTDLFFKKDKEFRNKMVNELKKKKLEKNGGGKMKNNE